MKQILTATLLVLLFCFSGISQSIKIDKKLQKQINQLVQGFNGTVGFYAKNLKTGKVVEYQKDTLFPTASMVKIPILIGVMDKIEKGELQYHQPLVYKDSLLYAGEDILGSFKNNETITLAKTIMLMLTTSDNTASLWLQSLAGTGTKINEILAQNGFVNTRVNSRTPGREEQRTTFGWGQTTPLEMASLMEKIYNRQMISSNASEKMLRLLGRNYWDEQAISQIPPTVFVASKNGAVNASRSETVLVIAPSGAYIFSIITKNQKDESWNENNEGWVLARKLSLLLWNYYEPKHKWQPANSVEGK